MNMKNKSLIEKIWSIPPREDRLEYLNRGPLAWLHAHKRAHREDPDYFISTLLLRNSMILSYAFAMLVFFWALLFFSDAFSEQTPLFHFCRERVIVASPFSIAMIFYYYKLYVKNVDTDKYNPLIMRETGERIPNSLVLVMILPVILLAVLLPHIFAYSIYRTETLSFLATYYNSYIFSFITLLIWGLINGGTIFLSVESLIVLKRHVHEYRLKKGE
jgi:hypothetical protein